MVGALLEELILKGWEISGIKTILAICIKSKSHVDILNMSTRLFL